jgi:hypothetical protein
MVAIGAHVLARHTSMTLSGAGIGSGLTYSRSHRADHERLGVRDLDSKNGIQIDGSQRKEAPLVPGTELGIGDVVLIAESRQLIALRGFLLV